MTIFRALVFLSASIFFLPVLAQCNPDTSCCARPPLGNPCNASAQGVGNPIDLISGNKYQRETDMPALPGVLGLEIVRHYNSHWAALEHKRGTGGPLGPGWRHGYEIRLQRLPAGLNIYQADGAQLSFAAHTNDSVFKPKRAEWGQVVARADGYDWRMANGQRTLRFNNLGALTRITARGGEYLILTYLPSGALEAVTDPQGRRMEFNYQPASGKRRFGRLDSIKTPAGALWFDYFTAGSTSGLLIGTRSGTAKRSYHYEDGRFPVYLTGVSVGAERFSYYAYSKQGNAVESARGSADKLHVHWASADQVEVATGRGEKFGYQLRQIGEVKRITRITGGARQRLEYDPQGRLLVHARAGLKQRYTYSGSPFELQEIVSPSVFPGKQHTWTITRNAAGQLLSVVERGYTNLAQLRVLETRYRYESIHQRQVLVEVSGPAEGQFTQFEWDAQANFVIGAKTSAGLHVKNVYDLLGRVAQRVVSDELRSVQLSYSYSNNLMALNQPVKIEQLAYMNLSRTNHEISRVLQVADYDALGRKIASGPSRERMTRASYQTTGQLEALTTPEGEQLRWHYDPYGQLLAQLHTNAKGDVKDGLMTLRDEQGRLRAVLRHGGLGVAYAYMSQTVKTPAHMQDDFGRVLRTVHKEDGEVRYHYQKNGWLQSHHSVDGKKVSQERLEFDLGGRLVLREREGCTDRLVYQGVFLSTVAGCSAAHTFNRNPMGQIILHTQELTVNGQKLKFEQAFRYERDGKLMQRSLLDQRTLFYTYSLSGQTSRVALEDFRLWRTGPRTLVDTIVRAPHWLGAAALVSWRDGNGHTVQWDRQEAARQATTPFAPLNALPAVSKEFFDEWGRQTLHIPATGPNAAKPLLLIWDDAHRLIQVKDVATNAVVARYTYDSFGKRLTKVTSTGTTVFIYDTQHRLIAQADEKGRVLRQFVYGDHRVHTVLEGDKTRFIRTDWRGMPAQDDLPLRMAGQVLDEETGLYYNIHRYLDPQRWRYLSPDPLGTLDGADRYAYLNGNPHAGIDPLGLFKVEILGFSDPNHQVFTREAFATYAKTAGQEKHFSSDIIEYFVRANVFTDISASQFDGRNHFDNPNDTPLGYNGVRPGNYWIQQSIDLVNDRRQLYDDTAYVDSPGAGGLIRCKLDISQVVRSFGMNTHTLQDFYAHTNWVDPASRGGEWIQNEATFTGMDARGRPTWRLDLKESGVVPLGLNRHYRWDEKVIPQLFSGTAQGCEDFACVALNFKKPSSTYGHNVQYGTDERATSDYYSYKPGGKVVNDDKTTHAYWAKDSVEKGQLFHDARKLAIEHTIEEIKRLYAKADVQLRAAFAMDQRQLRSNIVIKEDVVLPDFPVH